MSRFALVAAAGLLALTACSEPAPDADAPEARDPGLAEAARRPLEEAAAVEDTAMEHKRRIDEAVEATGDGDEPR